MAGGGAPGGAEGLPEDLLGLPGLVVSPGAAARAKR